MHQPHRTHPARRRVACAADGGNRLSRQPPLRMGARQEGKPLRRRGPAQGGEHRHGVLARRVRHHAPLGGLPGLAAHAHLVRAPAGMRDL